MCVRPIIVRDRSLIQSDGGSSWHADIHNRRLGPPASGDRAPIGAGRFYPADRSALHETVSDLLDAVEIGPEDRLAPAYVVPHAAFGAAGRIAAEAYARMRCHGDQVERVILLGPSHTEPVAGCVVPNVTTWRTPLGTTPIDVTTTRMLLSDGHLKINNQAHAAEHSLEIQLPFLQEAVPHAMIVPILVGPAATEDIVVTLSALADLDGAVIIVTSDLGDASTASRTLLSILELAPERLGPRDACGVHALRGLLGWAKHGGLRAELLARANDYIACMLVEPGRTGRGGSVPASTVAG